MLTRIPCMMMRGGTSKGPFFLASDLPDDIAQLHRTLLAVMGSEHIRQIDGIGGGDSLTSKAVIVGRSKRPGIDVEYLGGNSSQLASRIQSERAAGQYTIDVSMGGADTFYRTFLDNGWLEPIKPVLIAANDIAHLQSQHRQDDRGDSANARRQGHL